MASVTLYRASDRSYAEQGDSLSPERATAEAYLDNPGFGGSTLHRVRVRVDESRVLDLRAEWDCDRWALLAEVLEVDVESLYGSGAHVHSVWERNAAVLDALAARWTWVRYTDDYPEGAETWLYLGTDDIDLDEV